MMIATRSARRLAAKLLDRPGGRSALAKLATQVARSSTNRDVEFVWDGAWLHRLETTYHAESRSFSFRAGNRFEPDFTALDAALRDFWYHVYKPAQGDYILDVGAGKGNEALLFSRDVGPTGRVLSIEAHPGTFTLLDAQRRRNHLNNVTALQLAVMDQACEVFIDDRTDHEANSVSLDPAPQHLARPIPARPLDEVAREHGFGRVDFLKMNIEGAERQALLGATEVLGRARFVCVACHDFVADATGDERCRTMNFTIELLQSRGFDVVLRSDDSRDYVRYHVHARRAS